MNKKPIFLVFLILVLTSVACGSTAKTLDDVAKASTQAADVSTKSVNDKVTPTTEEQKPTEELKPTAVPENEPLRMIDDPVFIQSTIETDVIFTVENPNSSAAINSSSFDIVVYDEAGTILDTDSGYLELVLPGEKLPVVTSLFLEEGQKPAKVDVQLTSGTAEVVDIRPPLFTAEQVTYVADEYFPKVTALLKNNFDRSFETIEVTAVAYDKEGKVIGGGFTYLDFLPANGQAGVEVSINTEGEPDKVDLVASISSLSMLTEDNSQNQSVELVDYGWTQAQQSLSVAFLLKNSNVDQVVKDTQYQVTAYDEAGTVLGSNSGYVSLIFPSETVGQSESMYLPDGAKVTKVDVQINPGQPSTYVLTQNPFSFENVNYIGGSYSSKVTGIVKNSYTDKISTVIVAVVGYDKDGKIIGGGFTFVDVIPANGQAAFEILVDFDLKPDRIETYATPSGLSLIGD